ncbi:MAG: fumarate hydratase C-terminal domain-containing protein [Gammaproteobacteria bacterium]|nr:fumarate hydratase C-terminal domain-containing protein [Gammaproteobacteria bacterium]
MLEKITIDLPALPESLATLKPGSIVYLNGVVYTAREGVYDRVLNQQGVLPVPIHEITNANFHCSPAASVNTNGSYQIGAVTATASFRFSKYMSDWLDITKTKIVIGKGGMPAEDYKNILAPRGAVYLTTVGYGTGALLGQGIKRVLSVHWLEELGIAQAMWMFEVCDFGPFLVDSDLDGKSLFAEQGELVNQSIEQVYDGLRKPTLLRYGETDNRKDELI